MFEKLKRQKIGLNISCYKKWKSEQEAFVFPGYVIKIKLKFI